MKEVIVEKKEGYLLVTLNRPHVRNAINFEVMDLLEESIEQVKTDGNCKAMVITGTGNVFCSGGDLKVFHLLDNQKDAYQMLSRMGEILYKIATLPKPVFAFLNGPAVGGGLELATACDFRYVKKGSFMGFIQIQQGITTGWGGGALLLERVAESKGLEWLMSGRKFSEEEASLYGFANGVVSNIDEKTIVGIIEPIIKNDINALMAYKSMTIRKKKASDLYKRMQEEIKRCSELWVSPFHMETVERFQKKSQ
ncbi:enoyl-CoA hydratase/isomerase family protein [Pradoshia sp. D12]|uniref:enoyl-CoA hydratase/isomerase family protein n=1 Tax=Bacillaceae TaxID=186817 RepID=UPI001127EAAF|nr:MULTISPECIES: enoyl-CoA hydratase/isomerase family protein [Bacillaceae]QFK70882.1 enoyl-CoA hydratase/isomerase family protein [Pradoshia sp. D12]TPF72674.1 enoyl-CoA hydratase/isomerase family protein [Bacillus sp. D12]